jgi:hypothetical protein
LRLSSHRYSSTSAGRIRSNHKSSGQRKFMVRA